MSYSIKDILKLEVAPALGWNEPTAIARVALTILEWSHRPVFLLNCGRLSRKDQMEHCNFKLPGNGGNRQNHPRDNEEQSNRSKVGIVTK